jgi:GT2 family glycosyltransferase
MTLVLYFAAPIVAGRAHALQPRPPAPLVSILVISYNTCAMTLDCLQSVIAETSVPYELIVLDNASPDGSGAVIAAAFPGVRLIASPLNHGFAKGTNLAAREARGEYLLLLNPDTLVLDRAIDKLLAFAARRPEAGIWGGRTLTGGGTLDPSCAFGDHTLWSIFCRTSGLALLLKESPTFNPQLYGGWRRDSERDVDVVMGCFFLIRKAVWDALGGFDPTFVMYGEEADLCRRARARGARPRMTPEATIVHYGGASSSRVDKDVLVIKATITLARRYLPSWQQSTAIFLLRMLPLSRKLGATVVASLTESPDATAAARRWGAVWARRAEWQDGLRQGSGSPVGKERVEGRGDGGGFEDIHRPGGGLAEERLDLGEDLLDRVEVRGVRRQLYSRNAHRPQPPMRVLPNSLQRGA